MICSKCSQPARTYMMPYEVVDLETGERRWEQVWVCTNGCKMIGKVKGHKQALGHFQDLRYRWREELEVAGS